MSQDPYRSPARPQSSGKSAHRATPSPSIDQPIVTPPPPISRPKCFTIDLTAGAGDKAKWTVTHTHSKPDFGLNNSNPDFTATTFGDGSSQLPVVVYKESTILDGFGAHESDLDFIQHQPSIFRGKQKDGETVLHAGVDSAAAFHGANVVMRTGKLGFKACVQFLKTKNILVSTATLANIFFHLMGVKYASEIVAVLSVAALTFPTVTDFVLQGYAMSVEQPQQSRRLPSSPTSR